MLLNFCKHHSLCIKGFHLYRSWRSAFWLISRENAKYLFFVVTHGGTGEIAKEQSSIFENGRKKSSKSFQTYCLCAAVMGGGYSVFLIMNGSDSILGFRFLDYPSAKTGGAVNGGCSPFILTVDCSGWLRYPMRDYLHLLYADQRFLLTLRTEQREVFKYRVRAHLSLYFVFIDRA